VRQLDKRAELLERSNLAASVASCVVIALIKKYESIFPSLKTRYVGRRRKMPRNKCDQLIAFDPRSF
jgi:hypothetical protein